jgi:hypothetical protein
MVEDDTVNYLFIFCSGALPIARLGVHTSRHAFGERKRPREREKSKLCDHFHVDGVAKLLIHVDFYMCAIINTSLLTLG